MILDSQPSCFQCKVHKNVIMLFARTVLPDGIVNNKFVDLKSVFPAGDEICNSYLWNALMLFNFILQHPRLKIKMQTAKKQEQPKIWKE